MIVLELLPKGDLRNYLLKSRSDAEMALNEQMLLNFCQQIACGLIYLSSKGFVHRDLAARNILMSDDEICKVIPFKLFSSHT